MRVRKTIESQRVKVKTLNATKFLPHKDNENEYMSNLVKCRKEIRISLPCDWVKNGFCGDDAKPCLIIPEEDSSKSRECRRGYYVHFPCSYGKRENDNTLCGYDARSCVEALVRK